VTLDGVGHYPMLEAPEAFADAVLAFLDDAPTTAP
jgi:pimeloyl-ACP methyl ester carboxylesterase